jgi:hypothetical protein
MQKKNQNYLCKIKQKPVARKEKWMKLKYLTSQISTLQLNKTNGCNHTPIFSFHYYNFKVFFLPQLSVLRSILKQSYISRINVLCIENNYNFQRFRSLQSVCSVCVYDMEKRRTTTSSLLIGQIGERIVISQQHKLFILYIWRYR